MNVVRVILAVAFWLIFLGGVLPVGCLVLYAAVTEQDVFVHDESGRHWIAERKEHR